MRKPAATRYASDLTATQWQAIKPLLDWQRRRKHSLRTILNAMFYLTKTGCQWRYLPDSFPPWQTVYYYFRRWKNSGLFTRLVDFLRQHVRRVMGRNSSPSVAIIDSQSVKTSHMGGARSFDGGKLVKGRKRHILTDTLGLLLVVLVHPAGIHDSQRAPHLLARVQGKVPRLQVIFADEGYAGTPAGLVWRVFGWFWHIVRREEGERGFVVLRKRWVVERTFAWLGGYRRLSKDYERQCPTSEVMVELAMARIMLNRIS
jgi:putative transposase